MKLTYYIFFPLKYHSCNGTFERKLARIYEIQIFHYLFYNIILIPLVKLCFEDFVIFYSIHHPETISLSLYSSEPLFITLHHHPLSSTVVVYILQRFEQLGNIYDTSICYKKKAFIISVFLYFNRHE